MSQNNHPIF